MLFGFFPHPDCYIQVVNINFGWMSTNVSQVKPRYKDTKWLKCVPCQTEHVSIYASIWRSVRQCRCRYRANNNVWPPETNFFTYLMMKPRNILGTYWHIDQLFLEGHFGKQPYVQKLSVLTSQEPFNDNFRPWSLDKKGAPNSWLYSRLFMEMTPWHLNTLIPCILISWHGHWNGKHWTLGFDPPILTTSKVKKWWCCRNCVKDLGHRKKGEGGRKSISPAIFVFEGFLVT